MSITRAKRRLEATTHEGETHTNLDLRSMKAFSSTWKDCVFIGCTFDLSDWRSSRFEDCQFTRCSLRLVNLSTSFFEKVTFYDCDMEQSSLMGSMLRSVTFADCRMAYGDVLFQDCTTRGTVTFRNCNLHGSNLDFREVPRGTLSFEDCNFWSAKIPMGCSFWNASLDERFVSQLIAMIARMNGDARLIALAGDQYSVVCRAMDGSPECGNSPVSTTTPATGSNQIQNSAVPMDTTASVATPTMGPTPMQTEGV